jgi:hypothetical protein
MVKDLSSLLREMAAQTTREGARWPGSETLVATLTACAEIAQEQEEEISSLHGKTLADPPPSPALDAALRGEDTGNVLVFPPR